MDKIPRILIVDDDPLIRSTFAKCLESNHFELAVAEDWRSAFEKVHEFNPHVVLLDVVMPEVPGDKLVETIKGWKSEIEIIIITALVSEKMKKTAWPGVRLPCWANRSIFGC
ncbi:MAG: response regulator [Verrucomicrobia bacterium]|nr:response regulator [Verrucomicrobiota bacterium]